MKKVWIAGSGLRFPKGNASTNRLTEVAKGFASNGYHVKLIPLECPKTNTIQFNGKYKNIEYEVYPEIRKKPFYLLDYFLFFLLPLLKIKQISNQLSVKCEAEQVSIIFCGTSSVTDILLLYFITKRIDIAFIYDIVEDPFSSWLSKIRNVASTKYKIKYFLNFLILILVYQLSWKLPHFVTVITEELHKKVSKYRKNDDSILLLPIARFLEKGFPNVYNTETLISNTIIHAGSTDFAKDGILTILQSLKILKKKAVKVRDRKSVV